ncbi:MAG: hypothetical protein R6W90_10920 [Ignavibacteriaceae bacterium]
MKKTIMLFLTVPFILFAQGIQDTTADRIVISENAWECINDISENPDAVKYLLQTLVSDKEKFKSLIREVVNDPAMKEVIRELRNTLREDRGLIDEKKNKSKEIDVNGESDYTYLKSPSK